MDPNSTPALEPPKGQHSNLINPPSQLDSLIATSVICLVFAIAAIAARVFVKGYIMKKLQIEDCMSNTKVPPEAADHF